MTPKRTKKPRRTSGATMRVHPSLAKILHARLNADRRALAARADVMPSGRKLSMQDVTFTLARELLGETPASEWHPAAAAQLSLTTEE